MTIDLSLVEEQALLAKIQTGFNYISGTGWEQRADYAHFWPLIDHLHMLAYGPEAEVSGLAKGSLSFMLGAHAGRTCCYDASRPYFHDVLQIVYVSWLLNLGADSELVGIHHGDLQYLPEHLNVRHGWVNLIDDLSPIKIFDRVRRGTPNLGDAYAYKADFELPVVAGSDEEHLNLLIWALDLLNMTRANVDITLVERTLHDLPDSLPASVLVMISMIREHPNMQQRTVAA